MLIAKKLTYIGITLRIMLNIERQIENFKIKIPKNSDLLKNGSSSIKKVEKSIFCLINRKRGLRYMKYNPKRYRNGDNIFLNLKNEPYFVQKEDKL